MSGEYDLDAILADLECGKHDRALNIAPAMIRDLRELQENLDVALSYVDQYQMEIKAKDAEIERITAKLDWCHEVELVELRQEITAMRAMLRDADTVMRQGVETASTWTWRERYALMFPAVS